jgi:hypothetical protein
MIAFMCRANAAWMPGSAMVQADPAVYRLERGSPETRGRGAGDAKPAAAMVTRRYTFGTNFAGHDNGRSL